MGKCEFSSSKKSEKAKPPQTTEFFSIKSREFINYHIFPIPRFYVDVIQCESCLIGKWSAIKNDGDHQSNRLNM